MFRLNLGGGVIAFETEGEADRVVSVNPTDLSERHWPSEVVENIRQYQARLVHSGAIAQPVDAPDGVLTSGGD